MELLKSKAAGSPDGAMQNIPSVRDLSIKIRVTDFDLVLNR